MGFGTSFGTGPYGAPLPAPLVEPVTTAISCRLIDPVRRDYVTDANGNPSPDDGTADRVYLLLSYADQTPPDIITSESLQTRVAAITAALQPLVTSGAIADLSVTLNDDGGSHVTGLIKYTNLATQQVETVPIA